MNKCKVSTNKYDQTTSDFLDYLNDDDLLRLNSLLPWQCFLLDGKGRKFGRASSPNKRNLPEIIPDSRIVELDSMIDLRGRHVLEIGCFEGIHTIALAGFGANVVAVDSRIENVVKTCIRMSAFSLSAKIFKCDVENAIDFEKIQQAEVTHHVGVLYHLSDPVSHLKKILKKTSVAIFLDTHFAAESELDQFYTVDYKNYKFKYFKESGRDDPFSGMFDHAKWLPLNVIEGILNEEGFTNILLHKIRQERFGQRVTILAKK